MFEKQVAFNYTVHQIKKDTLIINDKMLENCYYECSEWMTLEDCEELMFQALCEEELYEFDDIWFENEEEVRSIIREYLKIHHHCK